MIVLRQRKGDRSPDRRRELPHPGHLAVRGREILTERARGGGSNAAAELAEHPTDAEELVLGGEGAGDGFAVDRHVRDRAARREPRARLDFPHDAGHGLDVGRRRRFVLGAALTHHVATHGTVRHLRADVEELRQPVEGVEILRERLPLPPDAGRKGGAGDVLDAFHQADEPVVTVPTGANPTPQLPITMVVTPCQQVGVSSGSQI